MNVPTRRQVIVHYHLFKNGGSSIERMLRDALGDAWQSFDKEASGSRIAANELSAWLAERPSVRAVSSHQLVPPLPVGDFDVTPIVLLRDPFARVRSAWLFEWQKQPGLDEPSGSLPDYVRAKLDQSPVNVIADFQTSRLSHTDVDKPRQAFVRNDHQALERACRLLDSLPFFGLVERFTESLELMRPHTNRRFPDLALTEFRENVLQDVAPDRHARIDQLRAELGDALFEELAIRNQLDVQLYSYAEGRFGAALDRLRDDSSLPREQPEAEGAAEVEGTGTLERVLKLYTRGSRG